MKGGWIKTCPRLCLHRIVQNLRQVLNIMGGHDSCFHQDPPPVSFKQTSVIKLSAVQVLSVWPLS